VFASKRYIGVVLLGIHTCHNILLLLGFGPLPPLDTLLKALGSSPVDVEAQPNARVHSRFPQGQHERVSTYKDIDCTMVDGGFLDVFDVVVCLLAADQVWQVGLRECE